MKSNVIRTSPWATAAYSHSTKTSSMELSALVSHIDRCIGARGRLFELQCAADAVQGFVAPRIVTTALAFAIALGIIALLL